MAIHKLLRTFQKKYDVVKPDGIDFDDIAFEPIETITIPDDIETLNIKDNIAMLSDDGIEIDAPQKVKILPDSNRLPIAFNKIKKNIFVENQKEY